LKPIHVIDEEKHRTWVLPGLSHAYTVLILWKAIEVAVDQWNRAADENPLSAGALDAESWGKDYQTYEHLLPTYIHCLFSYTHNAFLLENGYLVLFNEIKGIAQEIGLKISVPKRPKRDAYIDRLRLVRNKTMTHWGGPDDRTHIDSFAGRLWGCSYPSKAETLKDLAFGYASVAGAKPRHLESINKTHEIFEAYLLEYDYACANMFSEIRAAMPVAIGKRTYAAV
jgi:hypothetical protein